MSGWISIVLWVWALAAERSRIRCLISDGLCIILRSSSVPAGLIGMLTQQDSM